MIPHLVLMMMCGMPGLRCQESKPPVATFPEDYCDSQKIKAKWDFVVVGAGSAGAVVARRLAENRTWKVLLLEAGGNPPPQWSPVAGTVNTNSTTMDSYEWPYFSADPNFCMGFAHGGCALRRAKVLGGCSSNNYMQYVRGGRDVYDMWASNGNPGWSYEDILPLFKKSENFVAYPITKEQTSESVSSLYHAKGGRLTIDLLPFDPSSEPIRDGLRKAYSSLGYPSNNDPNGESSLGFADSQTTSHDGYRVSTATAYLQNIPENMKVCKKAVVDRVILHSKRKTVKGVSFLRGGKKMQVYAAKEVILSAGSVGTVGILERSGIGRRNVLSDIQVTQIHDLPGVGENLQDHFIAAGNMYSVDKLTHVPTNTMSMGLNGFMHYINTKMDGHYADLQIEHYLERPGVLGSSYNFKEGIIEEMERKAGGRSILVMGCCIIHPKSRGSVHSTDNDPLSIPKVILNGLSEVQEQDNMLASYKLIEKVIDSNFMKKFNPRFVTVSQCLEGGVDARCLMRVLTASMFHLVGTCKMGPSTDKMAVVDHQLRVRGIQNLRIADGSIMPNITRGNTNAPIIMIGEKMAEILKTQYGS